MAAALVRAGGRVVQEESDAWVRENGPLHPGKAAVTTAGDMPATYVIHIAGPRYRAGQDNEGLLRTAVAAALQAATEFGARTVAMPAISAGIFGYPKDAACKVIAKECQAWVQANPDSLDEVRLVGWDAETAELFKRWL